MSIRRIGWVGQLIRFCNVVFGVRETQIQATSRPEYMWPEVWSSMSKNYQQQLRKSSGEKKGRSSTMPEDRKEFIILIQKIWSSRKVSRAREEHWNRRWNQCHASRKEAQEAQLSRRRKSMRWTDAGSNSMRQQISYDGFMSVETKLMNHKGAASKKAVIRVMKTLLPPAGIILWLDTISRTTPFESPM